MAAKKKTTTIGSNGSVTKQAAPAPAVAAKSPVVATTPVRNSPVPKAAVKPAAKAVAAAAPVVAARREATAADVAARAYEIWSSGQGGSEQDHWLRAERELRGA